MTSADMQLIGRSRLQKHVPRAGSFEVYSGIIYSNTVVGLYVTVPDHVTFLNQVI